MKTWTLEKVEKLPFTTALAEQYLALPNLPGERNVNKDHVNTLVQKMMSGLFCPERVQIAVIKVGSEIYKGNGQHTCTARLQALLPSNWSSKNKIERHTYRCSALKDAADLYAQFDPKCASRNYAHMARPHYATLNYSPVGMRLINLAAAALAFELANWNDTGRRKVMDADRYKLPPVHAEASQFIYDMLGSAKHMAREAVACAILRTYRIDQDAASTFWSSVRDGEGLRKSNPEYVLREYLCKANLQSSRPGNIHTATFRQMYAKCIHSWNAFRRNGSTDLKYHASAPLPVAK